MHAEDILSCHAAAKNRISCCLPAYCTVYTVQKYSTRTDFLCTFRPQIPEDERERKTRRWRMAVERSLGWHED